MKLGTTEILLILALALVIFGGTKLSGVGKAIGRSIREFKEEIKDPNTKAESEDKQPKE